MCVYCQRSYPKLPRHLYSAHKEVIEVAEAMSFEKVSAERKEKLDAIRKKGDASS